MRCVCGHAKGQHCASPSYGCQALDRGLGHLSALCGCQGYRRPWWASAPLWVGLFLLDLFTRSLAALLGFVALVLLACAAWLVSHGGRVLPALLVTLLACAGCADERSSVVLSRGPAPGSDAGVQPAQAPDALVASPDLTLADVSPVLVDGAAAVFPDCVQAAKLVAGEWCPGGSPSDLSLARKPPPLVLCGLVAPSDASAPLAFPCWRGQYSIGAYWPDAGSVPELRVGDCSNCPAGWSL